jgi:hypothetical protein
VKRSSAVLLVAGALALGGCGSGSPTVSAASWVRSFCGVATSLRNGIRSAGTTLPTQITSTQQAKADVTAFVSAVGKATASAESRLKAAGTPKVPNGGQIASAAVSSLTKSKGILAQAATEAAGLPTSSKQAFASATNHVVALLRQSRAGLTSLVSQNSAQLNAAAAKDPTCQALAAGG